MNDSSEPVLLQSDQLLGSSGKKYKLDSMFSEVFSNLVNFVVNSVKLTPAERDGNVFIPRVQASPVGTRLSPSDLLKILPG